MKKAFLSFLVFAFVALANVDTYAQKYFVYDGDTFNVLITCTNDNSRVTKVEFSSEGKWVEFKLVGYDDYENTDDGGFAYTVLDGRGKKYIVDYYRHGDHIVVTNDSTGDTWTLYRRRD